MIGRSRQPVRPATETMGESTTSGQPRSMAGFWFLIGLSTLGFTPCILVPAWDDYQQVLRERDLQRIRTQQMETEAMALRRAVARLDADPAVADRLSRRELGYRAPGDTIVRVVHGVESERAAVAPPSPGCYCSVSSACRPHPQWRQHAGVTSRPTADTAVAHTRRSVRLASGTKTR